jgi:hypothetical protein
MTVELILSDQEQSDLFELIRAIPDRDRPVDLLAIAEKLVDDQSLDGREADRVLLLLKKAGGETVSLAAARRYRELSSRITSLVEIEQELGDQAADTDGPSF